MKTFFFLPVYPFFIFEFINMAIKGTCRKRPGKINEPFHRLYAVFSSGSIGARDQHNRFTTQRAFVSPIGDPVGEYFHKRRHVEQVSRTCQYDEIGHRYFVHYRIKVVVHYAFCPVIAFHASGTVAYILVLKIDDGEIDDGLFM
jgi:hypothetical protein